MLAKAEEYRAMAITCERLAKKTRDPYSKSVLVRSARKWRALEDAPRGTMSIARSRAPVVVRAADAEIAKAANQIRPDQN